MAESLGSLLGWTLYKADVKTAYLQTGISDKEVYVKPRSEGKMRSSQPGLMLTPESGLVNTNVKWQMKSDECFLNLRLIECQKIPQHFFEHANQKLVLVLTIFVDETKAAGENDNEKLVIEKFNESLKVGTVSCGSGALRLFGNITVQNEDLTNSTEADDRLGTLTEYALSRKLCEQPDDPQNDIERSFFASTNSSLGWIYIAGFRPYTFYASHLQRNASDTLVCLLIEQRNIVHKLQRFGAAIGYPRLVDDARYEPFVLTLADTSQSDTYGQLGVAARLIVNYLAKNSICP